MLQNRCYSYHFLLFFGLTLLLTPAKSIHPPTRVSEVKTEEKHAAVAMENAADLLHNEVLFKF